MLSEIIIAVRKAGEFVLSAHSGYAIKEKANNKDYVTEYDVETQRVLVEELKKIQPEARFLCEESDERQDADLSDGCLFIIDPIDGTTNFIKGYAHSAVSVAFCRDGCLTAGVVHNPFSGEIFYAERGGGAFLNGRPIHADTCGINGGIGLFGTSPTAPELREKTFAVASMMYEKMWDVRRTGSAALDLCYIACGRVVAFAEYVLYVWDFAAGKLIAEESGAVVTKMDGLPLGMEKHVSVLAGTPAAHAQFLELLRERGLAAG